MEDIALFILGVIVTHIYHVLSNRQQNKDMDELRQNNAILRRQSEINLAVLEETGLLDANRDENGTIIGKNATASARLQTVSVIQAKATVAPPEQSSNNTD